MSLLNAGVVVRHHSSASLLSIAAVRRLAIALCAGVLVGASECLFFVVALNHLHIELALWRAFQFSTEAVGTTAILACALAPVLAGAAFTWLATGGRASWGRVVASGISLLVASLVGLVVALALEPLGQSGTVVLIFRIAFTLASGLAALLCTWMVGWLLGFDDAWRRGMLVGALTAVTYLAYALLIDQVPGFHVGGGNMAMPRVAMVGNLLAGAVGGTVAFLLLSQRSRGAWLCGAGRAMSSSASPWRPVSGPMSPTMPASAAH